MSSTEPAVIDGETGEASETSSAGVRPSIREHARTVATHWRPPDVWNHDRPCLKASWEWAAHGEHLPDDEGVRLGSRVATGLLLPLQAAALWLAWVTERGSRVLAAALLITLLVLAL